MELGLDSASAEGLHRYVNQVATALALTGRPYCLDVARPMNAYLALDSRLPEFPQFDTALLWDERHGWAGVLESRTSTELTVLTYLGGDPLPSPEAVAEFAYAFVAGRVVRRDTPSGGVDREELMTRLVEYALPKPVATRHR